MTRPPTDTIAPTIHRRTVLVGATWSVPTIAVAIAAPLAAASGGTPSVSPANGTVITTWKGDHHYGSGNSNPRRRAYDLPVTVTDATGAAVANATVTIVATGRNRDGDLLAVHTSPAPSNGGPESSPSPTATLTTGPSGTALFAISTQNLSSGERPADAVLTITVTTPGGSATSVVSVHLTEND
ncbi:transcriptional initiation protein Tat [Rathayibacter sp. VKM Ac-2630]|jgi:hypothetical protein|uniref:transcriptional initiation protein Tat n=1 Tax=Rathayibacter sp. VKM Ac-2630 TaxID=1938617 RepID=UPI0009823ACF|nr:transcriptional initiation protein Tat [Rathayibacter sp. VKM Ac-2630]OOB90178.1 transcriptional initiation protein Tat [Rathayibacter sp. VKM Ac-2630]